MDSLKEIDFSAISWQNLFDKLLEGACELGLRIGGCIIVYVVGRRLIKYLDFLIGKVMSRREIDPSVASFLKSLVSILLTACLLLAIVNLLGINNSSFVALFASIGLAFGMAMSGTLQNFSGGVMILLFRPYKVGDYIQAQGQEGTVKAIQIFNTVIITADNRTIFIPNGGLSTNTIINYNEQKNRRIEWIIGIDYGTDYDQAKNIIGNLLKDEKKILPEPAPFIALKALNDSSVDILIRVWSLKDDYWEVYFKINEEIYKNFAAKGINIPFPQLTVHMADKGK